MRCKSCDAILSKREAAHIEAVVDNKKFYTELCNRCRMQSTISYSVLSREYDHTSITEGYDHFPVVSTD